MSRCYTCTQDLSKAKKKFTWYLTQGFDPKDAAAEILRDPDSRLPPKQCCIVSLQTNIEVKDHIQYRDEMKEEYNRRLAAREGKARREREIFILFPVTSDGRPANFTLIDSDFQNLEFLATVDGSDGKTGAIVTNVTKIPDSLREKNSWTNEEAIMIWFGVSMKLISYEIKPVTKARDAGFIVWRNQKTGEQGILSPNDNTFINSRVLEYSLQPYMIQNVQISVNALTIEKEYPEENYYL